MTHFSNLTCEKLRYYVYCLIDPEDSKVFYIGKGKGNRVFQHALRAELFEDEKSEKLDKIREILAREDDNNKVGYYIIRHGLDEKTALEIESVLIDLLTFPQLNTKLTMTNLQSGYDQRLRGIRSAEDIEADYAAKDIEVNPDDFILLVNITGSKGSCNDLYEAAKGDWIIREANQKKITYVLAHYNGVVRGVYKPYKDKWLRLPKGEGQHKQRVRFEGEEVKDSHYLNANVRKYTFSSKNRPNKNPVQYIDGKKIQRLKN